MSDDSEPLEVILESIEQLNGIMTQHQNNCFKCSDSGPCKKWEDYVLDWNGLNVALSIALRINELPEEYSFEKN